MEFAVIKDEVVINVIVANDDTPEQVLAALLPDADAIVAVTENTGPAYINGDLVGGKFRPPAPFASWLWDVDAWLWVAPIAMPDTGLAYNWDEDNREWRIAPGQDGFIAMLDTPKPGDGDSAWDVETQSWVPLDAVTE